MLSFREFSDKYIKEHPQAVEWSYSDMNSVYYDYCCEEFSYQFYSGEDFLLLLEIDDEFEEIPDV